MNLNIPVPLKTDNAILAYALYVAGVPENRPPINVYDEPMLKKRGYSGIPIEEAIEAEYRKMIATNGQQGRGRGLYFFDRTPEAQPLLNIFWEQEQKNKTPELTDIGQDIREIMARAAGRDPATGEDCDPMDEREALVRIICIALSGRPEFVDRIKSNAWFDGSASAKATQTAPPGAKQVKENTVRLSKFEFRQIFQDGKRLEVK